MASLADFYPYIEPDVPGCPLPTIDKALIRVAIDFCTRSKIWSEIDASLSTEAGVSNYALDIPSGARAVIIEAVSVGTSNLEMTSELQLFSKLPGWQSMTGAPKYAFMSKADDELVLAPTPIGAGDQIVMKVAYAPTFSATSLPDVLARRHLDGIAAGAKGLLQAMPNQPWSNPASATFNQSVFASALSGAIGYTTKEGGRSALRTVPST